MDRVNAKPGIAMRTLPAFSIFSSIGYFLFMGFGLSPFVYYPEAGRFTLTVQADLGPPMFWYGWLVYAAAAGIFAAAISWMMPHQVSLALVGRLSWLLWVVPATLMLIILFLLRHYF
ncbi:MAG: hypothetical protein C0409_00725 [Novosphingobium sp.]|nr:hypothetical protein [Novosphingobium sp.]